MDRRALLLVVVLLLGLGIALAGLEVLPGGSERSTPASRAKDVDEGREGLGTQRSESETSRGEIEIGSPAPDFELRDLKGEKVRLSDFRAGPVLLNFWATWCGPCRVEMPSLQARYEWYKEQGFVVLGVNFDEPEAAVREFKQELGLTFPLLLDPGAEVQRLYRVRGYPSSVLVDSQGVVRDIHIGVLTEGQLDGILSEVGLGL